MSPGSPGDACVTVKTLLTKAARKNGTPSSPAKGQQSVQQARHTVCPQYDPLHCLLSVVSVAPSPQPDLDLQFLFHAAMEDDALALVLVQVIEDLVGRPKAHGCVRPWNVKVSSVGKVSLEEKKDRERVEEQWCDPKALIHLHTPWPASSNACAHPAGARKLCLQTFAQAIANRQV